MMAKGVTVKVAGLSELGKNFAAFSKEIKGKLLRNACRKAALEVRDAARANIVAKGLVKTGAMKEAVAARRMSRASSPGKEVFAVGVFKISGKKYANTKHNVRKQRVGKGYDVDPPEFYWKFQEFGTVRGIRPTPFLAPAFDQKKNGSPETMRRVLADGMNRATRRLAKPSRAKRGL
jgi:HK97 gp10 family phage protein